jgi:hypothetical protein
MIQLNRATIGTPSNIYRFVLGFDTRGNLYLCNRKEFTLPVIVMYRTIRHHE